MKIFFDRLTYTSRLKDPEVLNKRGTCFSYNGRKFVQILTKLGENRWHGGGNAFSVYVGNYKFHFRDQCFVPVLHELLTTNRKLETQHTHTLQRRSATNGQHELLGMWIRFPQKQSINNRLSWSRSITHFSISLERRLTIGHATNLRTLSLRFIRGYRVAIAVISGSGHDYNCIRTN